MDEVHPPVLTIMEDLRVCLFVTAIFLMTTQLRHCMIESNSTVSNWSNAEPLDVRPCPYPYVPTKLNSTESMDVCTCMLESNLTDSNSTEASDAQSCICMPMECTSTEAFVNDTQLCRCIPTEWNSSDSYNTQLCNCLMEFNFTDSNSSEWSDTQLCCEMLTGMKQKDDTKKSSVFRFPINFLTFVPFPDEDFKPAFDQGHSIIPAVHLAAEQINNRTDILPPGFYMNILLGDSGCDKASKIALDIVSELTNLLNGSKNLPLGIIGPACSEDSIFVVDTFDRVFNLPVLYSGTTPNLNMYTDERPNGFGMISSAAVLTDTLIRVADKENWDWENIAVLYEDSRERFQDTYDALIRELNSSQQVGYTRQITSSQIPLGEVINRNIRIAVVFSGKKLACQLVCLAGQPEVNFVFPIHQLVFTEKVLEDFLKVSETEFSFVQQSNDKTYHCDKETMIRGLNGSILLNQALDSVDPDVVTVSNYTAGQVKQQYKTKLAEYGEMMNLSLSENIYAYPYYDATWALALGLNISLKVNGDILENVKFQGVSNWIDFSSSDDRHVSSPVTIIQIDGSTAVIRSLWNRSNLTYPSDVFISDQFTAVNVVLHLSLTVVGLLFAFLCLVFTVILQILNVVFREYPSVKASSPRLNHFIFFGCYSFVVAMISYTIPNTRPETAGYLLCNADVFCSVLGYCFVISTIFAKSWRTYRIFSHPFKTQRFLRDSTLAVLIMIFVFVNVLLFIPVLVVSPFKKNVSSTFDTSQWPPVLKNTSFCDNMSVGYFTIPLTFQILLTLATIFLATLNKNIVHINFRTTQQIFVLVYVLVVVWAVGGPSLVILYNVNFSINVVYSLYILLLVVTVVLCLTVLILPVFLLATETKLATSPTITSRRGSMLTRQFSRIIT